MFRTLPRLIAAAAAAITLLAVPAGASAAPAPAASAAQSPAPAVPAAQSPAPAQVPANAYRPGAVAQLPPKKPATAAPNATPPPHWAVTLTTDKPEVWPTHYATLTATANADVAGTPYYIMIYETTGAHRPLIWCSIGTTCSVSLTSKTSDEVDYEAEIATGPTLTYPPAGIQAAATASISWLSAPVSLVAQPSTAAPGQPIVLTASTTYGFFPDAPWPFLIEIYDATAGTMLALCEGTTCSYTATQNTATTHRYVAYTVPYSPVFPPPNIQTMSTSTWATWSPTGWTVSLSLGNVYSEVGWATATVNRDVITGPYWIEIYLEQDNADGSAVTGTRVANCESGTTCIVTRDMLTDVGTLVAFVSDSTTNFPPGGIQAVTTFPYTLR